MRRRVDPDVRSRDHGGFLLIELMIVLVVIAVVVSTTVTAFVTASA